MEMQREYEKLQDCEDICLYLSSPLTRRRPRRWCQWTGNSLIPGSRWPQNAQAQHAEYQRTFSWGVRQRRQAPMSPIAKRPSCLKFDSGAGGLEDQSDPANNTPASNVSKADTALLPNVSSALSASGRSSAERGCCFTQTHTGGPGPTPLSAGGWGCLRGADHPSCHIPSNGGWGEDICWKRDGFVPKSGRRATRCELEASERCDSGRTGLEIVVCWFRR